ncbi:MAG: hypothetical protein ACTHND_12080 [Asticcacaulis sp.]
MFRLITIFANICHVRNALGVLCAMFGLMISMAPQAEAFIALQHEAAGEVMVADGGWADTCTTKTVCNSTDVESGLAHDSIPVPHHHHCGGCFQMGAVDNYLNIAFPSTFSARLARPGNGPQLEQAGPSDIEQPPRG